MCNDTNLCPIDAFIPVCIKVDAKATLVQLTRMGNNENQKNINRQLIEQMEIHEEATNFPTQLTLTAQRSVPVCIDPVEFYQMLAAKVAGTSENADAIVDLCEQAVAIYR